MGRKVTTIAAGDSVELSLGGNYLVVEKSDQALEIDLLNPDGKEENHFVKQGTTLYDKDFKSIAVKNIGGLDAMVEIWTGVGSYVASAGDMKVVIDDAGGSIDVDVQNLPDVQITGVSDVKSNLSTGVTSINDVAVTAGNSGRVVTADPSNLRATVTNPEGSGVTMRVGLHSGVDANNGSPLPEGASRTYETVLDVWVYNPGAVDIDVPVEVETKS